MVGPHHALVLLACLLAVASAEPSKQAQKRATESLRRWIDPVPSRGRPPSPADKGVLRIRLEDLPTSGLAERRRSHTGCVMHDDEGFDEARAVRMRRRLRLSTGQPYVWEPECEDDPGVSWESLGFVRSVKVFPPCDALRQAAAAEAPSKGRFAVQALPTASVKLSKHNSAMFKLR